MESLSAIWTRLGQIPDELPSPIMRTRFEAMLQAYAAGMSHSGASARWKETFKDMLLRWWPRQPALQFALALCFLVIGLLTGRQFTATPQNTDLRQLQAEVHQMQQLVTLSLLQQQSASERLKGVNWSYRMERPTGEVLSALMRTLDHDSNVDVRLAAVDALRQFMSQRSVREGMIETLPRQDSPLVQIALIDAMVETREKQAVDVLRRLSRDREVNKVVRERAAWGIQKLS
jgi:hypothetical protein